MKTSQISVHDQSCDHRSSSLHKYSGHPLIWTTPASGRKAGRRFLSARIIPPLSGNAVLVRYLIHGGSSIRLVGSSSSSHRGYRRCHGNHMDVTRLIEMPSAKRRQNMNFMYKWNLSPMSVMKGNFCYFPRQPSRMICIHLCFGLTWMITINIRRSGI